MTQLVRTLRFWDMVMLIIGSVIGSGIFLVPGVILRQVDHSVVLASLVWIAGGVLSLLGALTYGELAAMRPVSGGLYVYIREGFGTAAGFLYGWAMFLAIAGGTIATLAVAFSTYLGMVIPLSGVGAKFISVGVVALVTGVNVWGTRRSSDLQNWTSLIKVLLIVAMSAALLWLGHGYSGIPNELWPAHASGSLLSSFGLAMIAVLWAYEGWQFITYCAGETVNPQKNFPRALFSSVLLLIFIYLLANVAYLAALGPEGAARTDTIAATSMATALGGYAGKLVSLIILISVFSAINSVSLTAPRVFYAMAADKLFFRKLAEVHPRFRTPAFAIGALGVWAAFLSCMGQFQALLNYTMFIAWIFYGLGAASIFVYRRKYSELPRPYLVPGYPWTPLLFVAAAAALVLNVIVSTPRNAVAGLGILGVGLPAFLLWRRRGAGEEPAQPPQMQTSEET